MSVNQLPFHTKGGKQEVCMCVRVCYLCLGSNEEVTLQGAGHHTHMLGTPNATSHTHTHKQRVR